MQICFMEKSTNRPFIVNGVTDFGRMKHKINGKYKEIYYFAWKENEERKTANVLVSEFSFQFAQEKETEQGKTMEEWMK